MNRSTIQFFLFFLITIFIFSCKDKYGERKENEEDGMLQAMRQEFLMTRDPALNKIPTERLLPTFRQLRKLQTSTKFNGVNAVNWTERGPNNIGGRTRTLLYDMNDAANGYKKVWAGSVGGGLWYTNDITAATPTWNKVNDLLDNLAISTIAQDPSNTQILYAGSGEGWFNVDAIRGLGIFQSTNGGNSWSQLSSTNNSNFYNVQKIVVATNGTVFACTRAGGLQRSTDNGSTWTKVLGSGTAGGSSNRAADVEIGGDGTLYCSLGIFTSDGIYRSTDNGTTWSKIYTSASDEYRIELACAPSNANYMYALIHGGTGDGIKKIMYTSNSTAATVTWSSPTNPNWCDQGSTSTDFTRGQAWYDLIAAVDPNNENKAFVGGIDVMETTNGGSAWAQTTQWASGCTSLPYVHADIHAIVFKPGSSSEFLVGCDGGIFRTTNSGASFADRNTSYNVTQYYCVAMSPTATSNYMLAGAQDNGTHKFSSAGINAVTSVTGGDGSFCFVSQTNSNYQITSYTNSNYYRSTNGGSSFSAAVSSNNGRFINPAELDKNNILYFGSTDGTYENYDLINGGTNAVNLSGSITLTNMQVSAIKADPNTNYAVYCAFSTSESYNGTLVPKLVKVINANGSSNGAPSQRPSATEITLPSLPAGAYISSIDVETGNSSHLLFTVSNYGVTSVWESTNSGGAWNNIEGNLPDMPVRWGIFIPSGYGYKIMLATELGVWTTSSINGTSTSWTSDNFGLANVRVDMLRLRNSDKTIAAATHGRGIFTTILSTVLPVSLSDFKGRLNSSDVELDWTSSTEQDLDFFDVEKSTDGKTFYSIGKVNAIGNSSSAQRYTLKDVQLNEVNYYRLKMVNADGSFDYSKVIVIKAAGIRQNIWVMSNPFNDYIDLRLSKQANNTRLQLLATDGKMIAEKAIAKPPSQIRWQLNTSLSKGVYFLRIIADDNSFSKKIIKN